MNYSMHSVFSPPHPSTHSHPHNRTSNSRRGNNYPFILQPGTEESHSPVCWMLPLTPFHSITPSFMLSSPALLPPRPFTPSLTPLTPSFSHPLPHPLIPSFPHPSLLHSLPPQSSFTPSSPHPSLLHPLPPQSLTPHSLIPHPLTPSPPHSLTPSLPDSLALGC